MAAQTPLSSRFLSEPDYARPLLQLTPGQRRAILEKLEFLYGPERGAACFVEIERLMQVFWAHRTEAAIEADRGFDPTQRFTERDVLLITYGDLLLGPGSLPLATLAGFLHRFLRGVIDTVHILPFFPYSSDRGFSIIDYEEVDPRLGGWSEIAELAGEFKLMFDGVFNHVSTKSRWFQRFLSGRPGFEDFFVAFNTRDAIHPDRLRLILRPRTSDLLTRFQTIRGPRWVWTTFSPDQVDLDFRNERVLQRVVEVLLYYVRRGADLVRLDAVTYIWRELGTSCAHLAQGHALVKLFRSILDVVAPRVALVTETNVPHADNIRYFGDGTDEAQLVYNFALPPLVLHTFHGGNCRKLAEWAASLTPVSPTATYLNFLDSHDGIGLLGAEGLLSPEEIDDLVARTFAHGGLVSWRDRGEGRKVPYELNITWYSALNDEERGEPQSLQVARFVASRAIALVLRGVPGVYLPSLFGARNDTQAILQGSEARSINRKTIDERALALLLEDRSSWVSQVARRLRRLGKRRVATPAFHPNAGQRVLFASDAVFAVLRERQGSRVLALVNVTRHVQAVTFALRELDSPATSWRDLLSMRRFEAAAGELAVTLAPYDVVWLSPRAA